MMAQRKTTSRPCPLCGAGEWTVYLAKQELTLVRCQRCTMVFVPEVPEAFSAGKFYEHEGGDYYASSEKLAGDYSPVRYIREVRLLRRHQPQGRILDVGCSTGGFLHFLRESHPGAYKVSGTDVATRALQVAQSRGVPVLPGDFFALDPEHPFDAITFWAVLEHVADPAAFLRTAQQLCAPGGHCFVLVPNIQSLAVRLLGVRYRYILPQHLNYFSSETLRLLVEKCGFEVVTMRSTHLNPAVILQDLRSTGGFVPDAERARLLVRTNALKRSRILAPLRWGYTAAETLLGALHLADNIVAVGRKPKR